MRNRLVLVAAWSFMAGVVPGAEATAQDDSFKPIVDEDRQIGIVRADVDDYVQDGLVAHYDGIRNAGAKKSHDDTATRWVDLVDEMRVASFSSVGVNVEKKSGVRDGKARWLHDGYYFDGTVFAQMQTGVALGMNATIQLVTTCDTANQMTNHFPNVFAAPDDFCFFFGNFNTTQRQNTMTWKHAPYAAPGNNYDRPTLPTWGGLYMTALLGGADTSSGAWTDDGYAFAGKSYFKMGKGVTLGRAFTIQGVCDVDAAQQITEWPNYVAAMNDYGVFTHRNANLLNWKTDAWTGGRSQSADWAGDYFTVPMTTDTVYIFDGTAYANGVERTKDEAVPLWRWTIGACENGANERYMVGKMQAVRFYGRPLTEDELAWNRKVDDIRYKGRVVTNVVVASNRPLCAGVESNGVYEVEGAWTFTAKPMAVADRTYAPAGYTIETWTDGGWSTPLAHAGTNYTYVAEAATPAVRLTWKFRSTDGTLTVIR